MNKEGVIIGMLVGIIFIVVYIIYFKFINLVVSVFVNWWFGISLEGIGIFGMCLNFVVVIVVNKFIVEVL